MRKRFWSFITILVCCFVVLEGCKKDKLGEISSAGLNDEESSKNTNISAAELIADSIFLYAQTVYLWNDRLPTYADFNPRQYALSQSVLSDIENELFAITQYAINPETGRPYEYYSNDPGIAKYSYVDETGSANRTAAVPESQLLVDLDGTANDLGLLIGVYGSSNSSYQIYVQAVFGGSAAEKAGLKRGDRITQINSRRMGSDFEQEYSLLNDVFYNDAYRAPISLAGVHVNGDTFSVSLAKMEYRPSVILKDSVYRFSGNAIGYLACYQFNDLTAVKADFDRVFDLFAKENVNKLIVDLRYNGGGYVVTAEYLCNLIAPAEISGKTMYTEHFNDNMQKGINDILKKQSIDGSRYTYGDIDYSVDANTYPFEKADNFQGVQEIVFLVSDYTASASELVINSLKPHIDVKLVGTTTYGKPVGFFPLRIGGYHIYYSMFETRNYVGEGAYYEGLLPDYEEYDNPLYDLGDKGEPLLAAACNYLTTQSFSGGVGVSKTLSVEGLHDNEFKPFRPHGFKLLSNSTNGMVENRLDRMKTN